MDRPVDTGICSCEQVPTNKCLRTRVYEKIKHFIVKHWRTFLKILDMDLIYLYLWFITFHSGMLIYQIVLSEKN